MFHRELSLYIFHDILFEAIVKIPLFTVLPLLLLIYWFLLCLSTKVKQTNKAYMYVKSKIDDVAVSYLYLHLRCRDCFFTITC